MGAKSFDVIIIDQRDCDFIRKRNEKKKERERKVNFMPHFLCAFAVL